MLPARIPKPPKRSSRWRSQAYSAYIRGYSCAVCGSTTNIEAAHVRMGSGAGVGQKPDDWRMVPLCGGPDGCHATQHRIGERSFWDGRDVEALIRALIQAYPKRGAIADAQRERGQ